MIPDSVDYEIPLEQAFPFIAGFATRVPITNANAIDGIGKCLLGAKITQLGPVPRSALAEPSTDVS